MKKSSEFAAREAAELGLAVNHACAVAAAARSGMKNGVTIRFMEVEGIDREEFLLMPRKRLFGSSGHRSDTPDRWFRYSYNKLRLCNIKVLLSTDITDIGAASERTALACFYENGSVTELVPEWSFDERSGKWSVLYSERECGDIPLAKTRYPDNTEGLRDILCRMAGIADELGFDGCCSEFRAAIFELDKNTVWHEDDPDPETGRGAGAPLIRYPVLPQQNAAIYNTACRSPSIMGEWYGEMLAAAEERGRAAELAELAKELTKQQRLAMLYAVNES